jgi:hypothetical protein
MSEELIRQKLTEIALKRVEKRLAYIERDKAYHRDVMRAKWAAIKQDPVAHAEYLAKLREQRARRKVAQKNERIGGGLVST